MERPKEEEEEEDIYKMFIFVISYIETHCMKVNIAFWYTIVHVVFTCIGFYNLHTLFADDGTSDRRNSLQVR